MKDGRHVMSGKYKLVYDYASESIEFQTSRPRNDGKIQKSKQIKKTKFAKHKNIYFEGGGLTTVSTEVTDGCAERTLYMDRGFAPCPSVRVCVRTHVRSILETEAMKEPSAPK